MANVGEKIMKIITNIILAFLTIAVFFMVYSYITVNVLKKDYTNYFGYTFFEVASGSMAETINVDDLVMVKLGAKYDVGDIITYKSGKDYITHRIISIADNGLITAKGDANNVNDNNINPKDVIGKVIKIYPKIGVWRKVILTPKVILLMFATLVLFNFAFSYNKKKEKAKKEQEIKKETITKPKIKKNKVKFKIDFSKFKKPKEKLPFRK